MTSAALELRGRGTLRRLDGDPRAEVSCYILEEADQAGQPRWRGFCQVLSSQGLLPGRQRLVLNLENGACAQLEALVTLEADSHSLRITFANARPLPAGRGAP
jgi:hypothetical protein